MQTGRQGIVGDCGGKHGKGDGGLCVRLQRGLRRRELSVDVNHHVSLLVAVHTGGAADSLGPGVDQLEGRLVTEHDFVPVVLRPAEVFCGKRQSAS